MGRSRPYARRSRAADASWETTRSITSRTTRTTTRAARGRVPLIGLGIPAQYKDPTNGDGSSTRRPASVPASSMDEATWQAVITANDAELKNPLCHSDDDDPGLPRASARDQRLRAERDQSRGLRVRPGPRRDAPRRASRGGGRRGHVRGETRVQLVRLAVHVGQRLARGVEPTDGGRRELRDEFPDGPLGSSRLRGVRPERGRSHGRQSDDLRRHRLRPSDDQRAAGAGPGLLPEPGRGPRRLRDHGRSPASTSTRSSTPE